MAMSGVLLTVSNFFVQLAIQVGKKRIPTLEIVFARSIVQLILVIPALVYSKVPLINDKSHIPSLIIMGICGFLSVTFIYLGIDKVPLGDATVIQFTSPVFTSLFAYLILQESCAILDAVCGLLSFVGIIIVARPSFIFGERFGHVSVMFHSGRIPRDMKEKLYLMGIGFVLLGAVFLSLYYVLTRKVGQNLHYLLNIFYPSLLGSIFIPIMMLPYDHLMFPGCWKARVCMLLVGVCGYLGLILLSQSLKLEEAGPLILVRNLDIIYAFLLQYTFWGILPTWWSMLGAIVIISATSLLIARRWVIAKKLQQKSAEECEEEMVLLSRKKLENDDLN